MMEIFRCGHPRTAENTYVHGRNGKMQERCRTCKCQVERNAYARVPKDVHKLYRRIRTLPDAITRAKKKLDLLEAEARALGMADILEKRA